MHSLRNVALATVLTALSGLIITPASAQQRTMRDNDRGDQVVTVDPDERVIEGEPIPAEQLGPGFIETIEAAEVRQRELDLEPPVRKEVAPFNRAGEWTIPSRRGTYFPKSGEHYITNKWGDLRMGISFPQPVTVNSVYVLGQGGSGVWADALRVIGYRNGEIVGRTEWFERIQAEPAEFEINLQSVDRIVFEARPSFAGGAWYGLDDLSYTRPTADAAEKPKPTVLTFDDLAFRTTVTGSGYGGLTWERGAGDVPEGDAVHPPVAPPGTGEEGLEDAGPQPGGRASATLPDLGLNDQGIIRGDAGQFSYPPDSCGAVGESHVVIAVNRTIGIFSKASGAPQSIMSLGAFQPGTGGDPRVAYDPHHHRWIVMSTDFDDTIFLAYSLSDNALGAWYKTSFFVSQGADSGRWPDYPTLGVDANGIYVASYMVGGGGHSLFAVDKAPLLDGSPSLGTVTAFRNLPYEGAVQPCITWGDSGGEFIISRASSTQLRVRQVTGPLTSPSLSERGFVSVPSNGNPPDAPALGSNTDMDTVGSRLMNAQWINGHIWTANTTNWGGRAAVRWYRIDSNSLIDETGLIFDDTLSYYFPAIAANADGDAAIGFSGSSASQYVGAYYSGREAEDTFGTMADPVQYKAGQGPQNNIDSYGRNRWGDYSLTVLDPTDEHTLWTIQTYAHATDLWGSWFAALEFEDVIRPDNNDCGAGVIDLVEGTPTAFTTVNANTDGYDESNCGFTGNNAIENDVWFRYLPTCSGEVTISTCDTDFNARLAVYFISCPQSADEAVACNDGACGNGDGAEVTVDVTAGFTYWVRIGGVNGATGTGTLNVACPGPACPADLAGGDSVVDVFDLFELLNNWGTAGPGADLAAPTSSVDVFDLFVLLNAWGPCN